MGLEWSHSLPPLVASLSLEWYWETVGPDAHSPQTPGMSDWSRTCGFPGEWLSLFTGRTVGQGQSEQSLTDPHTGVISHKNPKGLRGEDLGTWKLQGKHMSVPSAQRSWHCRAAAPRPLLSTFLLICAKDHGPHELIGKRHLW